MSNRAIQKERVKGFFLAAGKEIILSEGFAALTTKKIGQKAAYSYASIYNYFENFNELACLCVESLAQDCAHHVAALVSGATPIERILSFASLMIDYNAGNPHAYSPFLSTAIDFSYFQKRDGRHFIHPAYPLLQKEIDALGLEPDDTRVMADILSYIFHSKLHFFLSYGTPISLEVLHVQVQEEVNFILGKHIKAGV